MLKRLWRWLWQPRYSVTWTAEVHEHLERMRWLCGQDSNGDLIRDALALMDTIIMLRNIHGASVVVRFPDGEESELPLTLQEALEKAREPDHDADR